MFKMFKTIILISNIVMLLLSQVTASAIKLNHEKCSLEDSACLTTQARNVLKDFVNGIPDLAIEKLDPLFVDFIEVKNDGLIFELKNVETTGLKDAVIEKVSIDKELKVLKLSFKSSVVCTGDYTADGIFFTHPVKGHGKATISHKDVIIEMLILFDIVKNGGKDIMEFKGYRFAYDTLGGLVYRFDNLHDGDKNKYEREHAFLNENWRNVVGNYGRPVIKSLTDKIYNAAKIYIGSQDLHDLANY